MNDDDGPPRPGSTRWAQAEPIARILLVGGHPKVKAATREQADRLVRDAVHILNTIDPDAQTPRPIQEDEAFDQLLRGDITSKEYVDQLGRRAGDADA